MSSQKRILVIAGSDSSGGAGLEADQKVIAAHGCYAMTATTALTAQNTQGVFDVHHTPPSFVSQAIDLCMDDIGVDVVKIGMLASAETVQTVAATLKRYKQDFSIVLDPVMISTSGHQLLPKAAVSVLREQLLPMTTILTPNIPEAKLLVQRSDAEDPQSQTDLVDLAKAVHALGSKYVLLKGGHFKPISSEGTQGADHIIDVLFDGTEAMLIDKPFVQSQNTHGTGCSLASAIACHIACGEDVPVAVQKACHYVEAGIKTAVARGKGHGPINHFHSSYILPFAPGRFLEYLISRDDVRKVWKEFTEHDFVDQLGKGTLPIGKFKYYLIQDYLFLVEFARARALAASKCRDMSRLVAASEGIQHIETEMKLHINYCKSFNISKDDLEKAEASQACVAYSSYVLDVGTAEDVFGLEVALAPCMVGYAVAARRLYESPVTARSDQNPYWQWIENYAVDQEYCQAVNGVKENLEKQAVLQSPHRIEELVKIFIKATRMETGFWDMGNGTSI